MISCTLNVSQTTFNMREPLSKKEKQSRRRRRGDNDSESEPDDVDENWESDADHPRMVPINRLSTAVPQLKPSLPTEFVPIYLRYPAPPPADFIPRLPQPREIEYSGFINLSPSSTLLGANTSHFYELPVDTPADIYWDRYWGLKEWTLYPQLYDPHAPWLAYIGIDHPIFRRPLHDDLRAEIWTKGFSDQQYSLKPAIMEEFLSAWRMVLTEVNLACAAVLQHRNILNRDIDESDLPHFVAQNAMNAYGHLLVGQHGWARFVIAWRAFDRAMLELTAFLWWARDVVCYPAPSPHESAMMRGSIFKL